MRQPMNIPHNHGGRRHGRNTMPAYLFIEDILIPYVRASAAYKKIRTQEADAWISRRLTSHFSGWWLTDRRDDLKRVIVGETVANYRAQRKMEGVSPESIKRELAVASAACNYAISELNYDISNPFAGRLMTTKDRKTKQRRKRILSPGEVSALIMAAEGVARDIIIFAANTGCRQAEILALGWHQVRGDVVAFEPKEHKAGTHAVSALNETAQQVLARQADGEHVFTLGGMPIPRRKLHSLWDAARKRSGVEDVIFHDLRRYVATQMLAAGASMEDVKAQLRHADVRTTQQAYAQDSIDRARGALAMLRGVGAETCG